MLAYVIVVTSVVLLGLFVDENRRSSSIKLAFLFCGLATLIGWWQDWPAQLVSCTSLLAPVLFFSATRIVARFIPESDKRFSDFPLIMYFGLNLTHVGFFVFIEVITL